MTVVLGVEGGGSHSHAVVADASGTVLGVGRNEDNANWEDVGIGAAAAALRSCVMEALTAAGVEAPDIAGSVFGLAGIDFPIDEDRLSGIPLALGLTDPISMVNDSHTALRAGTDRSFGLVIVAGTGSVVAGRNPDGEAFRTLGLGPIFGDTGSATEVSMAGVSAVADDYTDRGPPTRLTELLCEQTGSLSVVEFLEATARLRINTTEFAPLVTRAAIEGDSAACRILSDAGERHGGNAVHVLRRLGMQDMEFDVVLAGGLFRSETRLLQEAVERVVRPAAPGATFILLKAPPVIGAVLMAMELSGAETPPDLRPALARATASALGLPVD